MRNYMVLRFNITAVLIFLFLYPSYGQEVNKFLQQEQEIIAAIIEANEKELDAEPDMSPVYFSLETLLQDPLTINYPFDTLKNYIGISSWQFNQFRIFTIPINTHGSAGACLTVIQYKTIAGNIKAEEIDLGNQFIAHVYKLPSKSQHLFLCLGLQKANSTSYSENAFVLNFTKEGFEFLSTAFNNESEIHFVHRDTGAISYNEKNKILSVSYLTDDYGIDPKYAKYLKDGFLSFKMKFNGNTFVAIE